MTGHHDAQPSIVYDRFGVTVHHAEALAVLRDMPDASVDSVICDPPYGLSDLRSEAVVSALTAWANGDRERVPAGNGFMSAAWDAFVPPPAVWDECLRVLKPGGHLAAFAGSRTAGLMDLSIRMAGFEIRDGLQWLHGQGFPKGVDVGKAIDKTRDDRPDILHVTAFIRAARDRAGLRNADVDAALGVAAMCDLWCRSAPLHARVPTTEQWERLRELLGFGDEMDAEVWRLNGRKGTPGEAWDQREVIGQWSMPGRGSRSTEQAYGLVNDSGDLTAPATDAARQWHGWNTALKPSFEPIILARKPLSGTVAATVLAHGTGAINVDACRTGHDERTNNAGGSSSLQRVSRVEQGYRDHVTTSVGEASTVTGRWPANVLLSHAPLLDEHGQPVGDACHAGCVEGCAVAELDGQSGDRPGAVSNGSKTPDGMLGTSTFQIHERDQKPGYADSGGASRFFPTFRWEAKAPTSERPQVNGVSHPTTKPLGLIRWLVRLLTPPGGLVVDPFAGSGTTGHAARAEGMRAVLVEREADYIPLIRARLDARDRTPAAAGDVPGDEPLDLLDLLEHGGGAA